MTSVETPSSALLRTSAGSQSSGVGRCRSCGRRVASTLNTMHAKDFRRVALAMMDAVEGAHMGHPDFRVNGRIFATLHADDEWGMVKLTPDQQARFVRDAPDTFVPEAGAWGRQGCTAVRLDSVSDEGLGEAMTLAWQNAVARRVATRSKAKRSGRRPGQTGASK